ncbi:MAG: iron export ABC transporter permease subunit FetB [Chromatiales bacterium]|nr:iron export ABC transporter permease subunit FetB [Chromatiales bacterium]
MNFISLTPLDLGIASTLVILLSLLSYRFALGISRQLIFAALRTTVQLLLIGLVLKLLFANVHLGWVVLISMIMLLAAGRIVMERQERRFIGWWGYGVGTLSMFLSSFAVTLITLIVIIQPEPWYQPQFSIPLLGMMLGNTMNGVALGLERLTTSVYQQRRIIEARLIQGQTWCEAIEAIRRDAMRVGMVPMLNAMAAAGVVSLPGMMTGQILAGAEPMEAVKYQILIMFLIASGTGFGTMGAVHVAARRLFDERERLRLDRIT